MIQKEEENQIEMSLNEKFNQFINQFVRFLNMIRKKKKLREFIKILALWDSGININNDLKTFLKEINLI